MAEQNNTVHAPTSEWRTAIRTSQDCSDSLRPETTIEQAHKLAQTLNDHLVAISLTAFGPRRV